MYDNSIRPMVVVALCRWTQAPASNTENVDLTEKLLGTPSSFSTDPHNCPTKEDTSLVLDIYAK